MKYETMSYIIGSVCNCLSTIQFFFINWIYYC